MKTAWPTAQLVHLPLHASWLNQVEIYSSILQRKAITPSDFADLTALAARVLAFQNRYNHDENPFDWRYRRDDLTATVARLGNTDLDLRAALKTLPVVDQQLLGLTLEGFSTTEAALAVGVSPGAARTRMARARQRLRAHLSSQTPVNETVWQEGTP